MNILGKYFRFFVPVLHVSSGGGGGSSAPDPWQTAMAQLSLNKQTSAFEAKQNRYTQKNPFGKIQWANTGTEENPNWVQQTTLSPQQKALYDTQLKTQRMSANKGHGLLKGFGGQLEGGNNAVINRLGALEKQPMPTADLATRQHVEDALMQRLNPQLQQDEEALRTRLANQGLQYGGEAYGNAMRDMNQRVNDARLAAIAQGGDEMQRSFGMQMQGRNQRLSEIMNLGSAYEQRQGMNANARNQRLAEIAAMIQQSGNINLPTYGGATNISSAQAPDYANAANQKYQGDIAKNSAQTAQQNALMSALAQLGSSYMAYK